MSPDGMQVIWTVCAIDEPDERYVLNVVERAAREGVRGIEMCNDAVDRFIFYRGFPRLARRVRHRHVQRERDRLARITERAAERGLRFGLWHHEVFAAVPLLEAMPEFRAADGLIDLENSRLYDWMRTKCGEFLEAFPAVRELVLTLTETQYDVAHRPFTGTPSAERIRRVLQAVADATDRHGRTLVIRPFSALRADELDVSHAVQRLRVRRMAMMYKTEPFDWNPFLPNETLFGSIPGREVRAETDAGAEYYGQGAAPCCYARHIARRLQAARRRGATVAVIRVDRGARFSAMGHPLNEVNVIAPTRRLLHPERSLMAHRVDWMKGRHGPCSSALMTSLERTFNVVKQAFYAGGQSLTHNAFPSLANLKHIQAFALFEEGITLRHIRENWGILPGRRTLAHAGILAEKGAAVALAAEIRREFDRLAKGMSPESREAIGEPLERLERVAEAFRRLCRVLVAHMEEMAEGRARTTSGFGREARRFLALAELIRRRFGRAYFRGMPVRMRELVDGLRRERALEIPLRRRLAGLPGLVDAALCGFASEGHRLAKRLHSGRTFTFRNRWVRATGMGPGEGIAYRLRSMPGRGQRLTVTLASDGEPCHGVLTVGARTIRLDLAPFKGFREVSADLAPSGARSVRVSLWSTAAQPCRVAEIRVEQASHAVPKRVRNPG